MHNLSKSFNSRPYSTLIGTGRMGVYALMRSGGQSMPGVTSLVVARYGQLQITKPKNSMYVIIGNIDKLDLYFAR